MKICGSSTKLDRFAESAPYGSTWGASGAKQNLPLWEQTTAELTKMVVRLVKRNSLFAKIFSEK